MDGKKFVKAKARKSTGGKAPRKMICEKGPGFDPRCAPSTRKRSKRNEYFDVEAEDKETQTYPSTSDSQTQAGSLSVDRMTQTEEAVSVIRLQKDIESMERRLEYMDGERTQLYHRIGRQENLERELLNQKTSLCTKDCCKDSA